MFLLFLLFLLFDYNTSPENIEITFVSGSVLVSLDESLSPLEYLVVLIKTHPGQEKLKPIKAFMSSTDTKFKAEHCINGKDDGPDDSESKNPDMCHTQETFGGKKADPAPWFAIDFGGEDAVSVGKVLLANRASCCGEKTKNVEVRLSNDLPTDGKSMFTGGQLLGKFIGPGSNGQKIEIDSEEGWERMVGRFLIIQMDHTDKPDALNLKEVTAFGFSRLDPAKGQFQSSLNNFINPSFSRSKKV